MRGRLLRARPAGRGQALSLTLCLRQPFGRSSGFPHSSHCRKKRPKKSAPPVLRHAPRADHRIGPCVDTRPWDPFRPVSLREAARHALARKTFRFSLIHLSLLFAALLVDHYLF